MPGTGFLPCGVSAHLQNVTQAQTLTRPAMPYEPGEREAEQPLLIRRHVICAETKGLR